MPDYRHPRKIELTYDQVAIARAWSDRSQSADDPFSKFFCLYAGLNAIYWLFRSDGDKEIEIVRDAIADQLSVCSVERITRSSEVRQAVSFLDGHGPVRDMKARSNSSREPKVREDQRVAHLHLRSPDHWTRLKGLIAAIYQIRCNLFHGGKSPEINGHDYRGVSQIVPALDLILNCLIKDIEDLDHQAKNRRVG